MRISDWSSDVCSSDLAQVDGLYREQCVLDIGKLIIGPERLEVCEDFQKILAAYRFDNEAVAIAMDHHAVTRKFEIGRDAQSLTLVVPEQFGFSWRDGNCFFPGHIDLLCICMNICIVLGKCQDCSPCRVLPYLRGDN